MSETSLSDTATNEQPNRQPLFDDLRFDQLGLRDSVMQGLEALGFEKPTPIQAKLIPAILEGSDVIGLAKTGTGKTASFGLPLLHKLDKDIAGQALILTPTRELAQQVAKEINKLGTHTPIRAACIIGGESMRNQKQAMENGAQIIVGTPGRVLDMFMRGQLAFGQIRHIILDEVDRMFDIGFRDDIRRVIKDIKNTIGDATLQTVFVSATLSDEIERLARSSMRDDVQKIQTISGSLTVEMVDQKYLSVEPWDKPALLAYLLKHEDPDTTIVFCRTKATVRRLAQYLEKRQISCRQIHGDMHQTKRNRVMETLRQGKLDVLIASDLAARGLDVAHITHVINYDLPEDPDMYVHRIGRTARAGRKGIAWSFVSSEDGQKLTEVEKFTGVLIEKIAFDGFQPGPLPRDIAELREKDRTRREQAEAPKVREVYSPPTQELSEQELQKMFPGGIVPKSAPRSTLASRFKTRRR